MNDQPLQQLLATYCPSDKSQQHIREQMLQFLNDYSNCFDRSCISGHFTASAFLLNKSGDSILLMYHKKLQMWLQPGGHCDGNADVLAVAIKEAQEESGIQNIKPVATKIFDLDIHKIPAYKNDPEHLHYDIRFLLQVQSNKQLIANDESEDLKWFHKDQPLPTNEPSVVRMFHKWLQDSVKEVLS